MSDIFHTTKEKLFPANAHDIFIVFTLTVILQVTRLISIKKKNSHLKKKNLFYGKNSNDIKPDSFLLMNFHYVLPSCPQHCGIIQQSKINARYPLECKYGTIQSKSIAEVQIGCHASGLIFVHSREVSVYINYTHLYFLLCNTVIVYYWLMIF